MNDLELQELENLKALIKSNLQHYSYHASDECVDALARAILRWSVQ